MTLPDQTVVARRQGRIGRLTLNRPRALNALDPDMIASIGTALDGWRDDPKIHAVVIEGEGRAFCAGGDVRAIRTAVLDGDAATIEHFFAREYALNQDIADYPKPYIALIAGVCMGGGIGVSVHGSARVVTPAAAFAMPETAIGLFPDIGATHILPRLRGEIGMWMALTGARLDGVDAAYAGLATHLATPERLAILADELAQDGPAVLASVCTVAPSRLEALRSQIDHCFGQDSVAAIVAALEADGSAWANEALTELRRHSPSSILWTFEIVRRGAYRTLPQCLAAELSLTRHATVHPDFAEGVRAMIVDKDRTPRWSPDTLEAVDPQSIARLFTP